MGTLVTPEETKELALKFLRASKLMVIGTSEHDLVWSATVHFAVTDDFEVIFYSRPDTRHTQNIQANENVSVVVTEMPIKNNKIKSIQLAGVARAADGAEWNTYYSQYEKKYKWAKNYSDHIIYVVKPNDMWMINEGVFGHMNRVEVEFK